jgi:hypothetical protein
MRLNPLPLQQRSLDKKKPAPTSKAASQPEEDGEEEDEPVKKTAAKGKGKAKKVVPEEVKEESEEEDQIRTGRKVKEASVGEAGSAASEEEESGGSEGEEEMTDEEVEEAVTKKASSNLYVADFPISSGPIDTLAESFVFPLLHPCHPCRHPSFISSSFSYPPTPLNPSPISQRADAAAHKASLSVGSYPHWDVGTPVPYAALVACFAKIESTSKRLEILSYLTAFLVLVAERAGVPKTGEDLNDAKGKGKAKVEPGDEILKVVYLCINRVSLPLYPCCSYMLRSRLEPTCARSFFSLTYTFSLARTFLIFLSSARTTKDSNSASENPSSSTPSRRWPVERPPRSRPTLRSMVISVSSRW